MEAYNVTSLNITGYDAPVANTWWMLGSDTLLVMLPGLGYTNQMPLMFYLRELGIARRWDVLEVNYDYRHIARDTSAEEWSARFVADVLPAMEAANARGEYRQIVLAGKSIGTNVMSTILNKGFTAATAFIWLTPLFHSPAVREAMTTHQPAVAVFGDQDFAAKDADLASIAKSGVHMIVMPGGDHSMMIENHVPESIFAMAQIMHELDNWLEQTVVSTGGTE